MGEQIISASGVQYGVVVNSDGSLNVNVGVIGNATYKYMDLSYTGSDLTRVQYRTGSAGSVLVTLDMSYDAGGNLLTVKRT